MYKLLQGALLVAVTTACAQPDKGATATATSAAASDSVILIGGQAYLMARGAPINIAPTATAKLSDSVILVGGQGFTIPTPKISASSTPMKAATTTVACKVVVHEGTPATTPPKYVFVVNC
jgi:hypothetical protein